MAKEYRLKQGSIHEKFFASRAKIQVFGGGFGNGKSSAAVVKALQVARDYPGANILMARSTYPKLNDTLRKTFLDFCPKAAIKSFPMSKNSDNTCTLDTNSQINFRYLQQKTSAEDGTSSSNLLSATYDLAIVDQIEDPEITHKDFLDLIGRMRGSALYRGDDPTMPRSGPRWIILTCNPSRNWVYTKIVKPYHEYINHGIISDDLLCERDEEGNPIIVDGKVNLIMELFEGPTTVNAHALPADFIKTLKNTYTGVMGKRYLDGSWEAYEGLVYPDYSTGVHGVDASDLAEYLGEVRRRYRLNHLGGYDFGIVSPSCYLHGITDHHGNIFIVDGFYQASCPLSEQAEKIALIQQKWGALGCEIYADPSIFRKTNASTTALVGKSTHDLLFDLNNELMFVRGNNAIENGIIKVSSYLSEYQYHYHPINGTKGAPYIYFNRSLTWLDEEFTSYFWKTNKVTGQREDTPHDGKDHALDALKYLLSRAPEPANLRIASPDNFALAISKWHEMPDRVAPNSRHTGY